MSLSSRPASGPASIVIGLMLAFAMNFVGYFFSDKIALAMYSAQRVTETEAIKEIEAALAKGPRRGPKPAEELVEEEAMKFLRRLFGQEQLLSRR